MDFRDPLIVLPLVAVLLVLGTLLYGVGNFGRGGGDGRQSNRIMRWRVGLQGLAVAIILLYVWLRGGA